MLSRIRYFLADLGHWLSRSRWRLAGALAALLVLAAAGVGGYLLAGDGGGTDPPSAPAPEVIVSEAPQPEAAEDVGFPAFATANTTRVAGADPATIAAGVALAVHPSTGGVPGPDAVTLVDAADWAGGVAAASLVADPVGAPILVTDGDEVPELTASALEALAPAGSPATDGARAFAVAPAAAPDDLEALAIEGANPAEVAAEIEELRATLAGEPEHIVLASSDEPQYAMPAAGWAARSGDPILFAQRESLPQATRQALRRNSDVPVYVLGPPSVISEEVVDEVGEIAASVERVGGEDPVENAIEFARYADGSFGWDINDPGHGIVIANGDRPLDAGVAAPLSAAGTWGPLLVTDDAAALPAPLSAYLLDLKPGYEDDPTRAIYNHAWLIGDAEALSVDLQAEVDDLAALVPVTSGRGGGGSSPEEPELEPDEDED